MTADELLIERIAQEADATAASTAARELRVLKCLLLRAVADARSIGLDDHRVGKHETAGEWLGEYVEMLATASESDLDEAWKLSLERPACYNDTNTR
jgi:hypothetical protein